MTKQSLAAEVARLRLKLERIRAKCVYPKRLTWERADTPVFCLNGKEILEILDEEEP